MYYNININKQTSNMIFGQKSKHDGSCIPTKLFMFPFSRIINWVFTNVFSVSRLSSTRKLCSSWGAAVAQTRYVSIPRAQSFSYPVVIPQCTRRQPDDHRVSLLCVSSLSAPEGRLAPPHGGVSVDLAAAAGGERRPRSSRAVVSPSLQGE